MNIKKINNQIKDTMPSNFCIAPFQSTRQNATGKTSPCAFGAGEWDFGELSQPERWNNSVLNDFRLQFINNERPPECIRCWEEEDAGKSSMRQRQLEYFPDDYDEFIKTGNWMSGPKTAVLKLSNICNLACRSCAAWDSSLFEQEGLYYNKEYNTTAQKDLPEVKKGEPYNRFMMIRDKANIITDEFMLMSDNFEKIDFYGGEPFLNTSHLDLLEFLIKNNKSKDIVLFYQTNGAQKPHKRMLELWPHFKKIGIGISVDALDTKFEYMRWPLTWDKWTKNVKFMIDLKETIDIYFVASVTLSNLNIMEYPVVHEFATNMFGGVYTNFVHDPSYLSVHNLPDHAKRSVEEQYNGEHPDVIHYMNNHAYDPLLFKQFVIWMKRMDNYRNQDFKKLWESWYNELKPEWDLNELDLDDSTFYK